MNLEHLPPAVESLRSYILAFNPVIIAMESVLEEYDVTEAAVRARFETHFRKTPEEMSQQHVKDNSIDGYLQKFKAANSSYHPSRMEHLGRRFYFITDTENGKEEKRWYRFLIVHGYMVVTIDEITHSIGEVIDRAIVDDIALQIGWRRYSTWPVQGPQPSKLFIAKKI